MATKLSDEECKARGWVRIAYLDCKEWFLYWANEDGDCLQEITYPKEWPEWASVKIEYAGQWMVTTQVGVYTGDTLPLAIEAAVKGMEKGAK